MPQTVWLEFAHRTGNIAANGTDTTFFIDGRWSASTVNRKIGEAVEALRNGPRSVAYRNQLFVGITYAGGRSGAIHTKIDKNPPQWDYSDFSTEELRRILRDTRVLAVDKMVREELNSRTDIE